MLEQLREDIIQRFDDINQLINIRKEVSQDSDVRKNILASSIILAIYNAMEFMTREIIIAVVDSIKYNQCHVLDIKEDIQKNLIENAKNKNLVQALSKLYDKSYCQFDIETKKIISGGSVDGQYLRKILNEYAIYDDQINLPRFNGILDLQAIKDARNKLSHGNKAFRDSRHSDEDIEALFEYIKDLWANIVAELEICLNDQKYLKA